MVMGAALFIAAAATAPGSAAARASTPAAEGYHAPISAEDLVEVAEIGAPTLSPDGTLVAFRVARPSVADNRTRLDWYVAAVDGKTITHVGDGGGAQYEGSGGLADQTPVWDSDSHGLWFRARFQGAVALWHWRVGGTARREITDEADIVDLTLSADGSALRYTTGAPRAAIAAAEQSAYDEGVLVDHRLDIMQPIAGGALEGGRRVMQRLPTEWFERERLLWDAPRQHRIVNLSRATPTAAPDFAVAPALQGKHVRDSAGRSAEIVSDDGGKHVRLSAPGGEAQHCDTGACRSPALIALAQQPGGDALLLFERGANAQEKVWRWQPEMARPTLVTTTDGAQRTTYRAPRCTVAADALICTDSRPTSPPRLVRFNLAGGRMQILYDPNSEFRSRIHVTAETLRWGDDVTGVLLRPADRTGPLPLVVQYYHCAGFLKGGVGDETPMLPLVEHGIAILCLDNRRKSNGGGIEDTYMLALADIHTAIDGLAARGIVDPARIGIGGLSFGSEVALWAIRHSKRFAAATSASGQISPIYYWANALPGRGFPEMLRTYWQLGEPDTDRNRWQALSPAAGTAAIDTPLLMQLPESEARYIIEFHTRLRRAGKPAELFVFADEPHIKNQPVHKRAVYARNLDWYRFWLSGEEDADPAKRAQYARWRQLRAGQSLPVPAP